MKILKPGLSTTVQDLGRPGHQRDGISAGGAMDPQALRLANLCVGNDEGAAGLEITLLGPMIEFTRDTLFAIAGAGLSPTIAARPVPEERPVLARAGAQLRFGERVRGCRAYLAVAGGIMVPEVLGGLGTYMRAGFGGVEGRALRAGDALDAGPLSARAGAIIARLSVAGGPFAAEAGTGGPATLPGDAPIRVIRGAHFELFDGVARSALLAEPYRVSPQSDRMGYRLDGPRLALSHQPDGISEPVALGTIQVPPDGQPIVLMADRQSTGGYPRAAQVATADIPRLAQMGPGDVVRFAEISLAEAEGLLADRERELVRLRRELGIC